MSRLLLFDKRNLLKKDMLAQVVFIKIELNNEWNIFFKLQGVFKVFGVVTVFNNTLNHYFLIKNKGCSKSKETETVFTKTKINKGNVNFFQITRCIQKVWTLKLYLPRQK